jgi:hypothetical protein
MRGRIPGAFKLANRRRPEWPLDPRLRRERRVRRILASIQSDLDNGGRASVRQILRGPRELYRIELELPEMAYQRTTILDRDSLTRLLAQADESVFRTRITIR